MKKYFKTKPQALGLYFELVIAPIIVYFVTLGLNWFTGWNVEYGSIACAMVGWQTSLVIYNYRRIFFGIQPDGSITIGKAFQIFTYIGVWLGVILLLFSLRFVVRVVPISMFSLYLIGTLLLTHLIFLLLWLRLRSRW